MHRAWHRSGVTLLSLPFIPFHSQDPTRGAWRRGTKGEPWEISHQGRGGYVSLFLCILSPSLFFGGKTQKRAKGRKSHLWENRPCSWYNFLSGEVLQRNFLGDSKLPHRGIGRWQVSKHNFLAIGYWFWGFCTLWNRLSLYQFWHVYPIVRWCYTGRFARTIFSATQRCYVETML